MTLRETGLLIRESLRARHVLLGCTEECIEFGKPSIPSEAPFVWIYPQPISQNNIITDLCQSEFLIYCGVIATETGEAMFDALEFAEKCLLAILDDDPATFQSANYAFDMTYGDIAVAYVSLTCDYSIGEL